MQSRILHTDAAEADQEKRTVKSNSIVTVLGTRIVTHNVAAKVFTLVSELTALLLLLTVLSEAHRPRPLA